MADESLRAACAFFGVPAEALAPYGTGLINRTWVAGQHAAAPTHVVQEINVAVFAEPRVIDRNLTRIGRALRDTAPDYRFLHPLAGRDGETLCIVDGRYFRAFDFVPDSTSHDRATDPRTAFEGARQFGLFARMLDVVDPDDIRPSIPRFHDLGLRLAQFDEACSTGNVVRIAECRDAIEALREFGWIAARLEHARATGALRTRLMHHDTKISNVLFDARSGEGLCVCDLDTVMPGTFLSDVGDMMRTYLCAHDENHAEPGAISVRAEYYDAIEAGYLGEMGGVLTADERALFPLAGSVMIYMQALRFLADYFNNDRYYGARYPAHNRDRAFNQLALLQRYCDLVRDRMPA